MKLQEILQKTTAFLQQKPFVDSPRLEAEMLLAHALKIKRLEIYLQYDRPLQESELDLCRNLLKRRAVGEPMAYVIGQRDFFGLTFYVSPAVLIPRPETEYLVEEALQWLNKSFSTEEASRPIEVLDLGCGSGCIGLAILKNFANIKLTALDISAEAIKIAHTNAKNFNLEDKIDWINDSAENFLATLTEKKFDLVVANPPYIDKNDSLIADDVKKYEPHLALFAENNGFSCVQNWTQNVMPFLNDKSLLLMEIGYNQKDVSMDLLKSVRTFDNIKTIQDLSGYDRIIYGEKYG
ncbi:MAG: peptide chain release factor N(5)-glutamine methyltransferase [Pseudobdellovibrionaceae bacterium]